MDFTYFISFLNLFWGEQKPIRLPGSHHFYLLPPSFLVHFRKVSFYGILFQLICKVRNTVNKLLECTLDCIGDKNSPQNSCLPLCVSVPSAVKLTAFNYSLRHSVEIFNL